MAHAATHPLPIPSHLTRHGKVGKPRRQTGNPVADLKDMTRFEPIPNPAPQQLAVPVERIRP